jgi:hypothetical protein
MGFLTRAGFASCGLVLAGPALRVREQGQPYPHDVGRGRPRAPPGERESAVPTSIVAVHH